MVLTDFVRARRYVRALAALALATIYFVGPRYAWGASGVIEFDVGKDQAPGVVCLLVRKSAPASRLGFAHFLALLGDEGGAKALLEEVKKAKTKEEERNRRLAKLVGPISHGNRVEEALVRLWADTADARGRCAGSGSTSACEPKLEFDPNRFIQDSGAIDKPDIVCKASAASGPVAFIVVDFIQSNREAASVTLTKLYFQGSVASFEVDKAFGYFTTAVAGGGYMPQKPDVVSSPDANNGGARAILKLLPRCSTRGVRFPPTWTARLI